MRIGLFAVGRLKAGLRRILPRAIWTGLPRPGPAIGLELSRRVAEVAESRASNAETRKREEAAMLRKALGRKAVLVLLDERGKGARIAKVSPTSSDS